MSTPAPTTSTPTSSPHPPTPTPPSQARSPRKSKSTPTAAPSAGTPRPTTASSTATPSHSASDAAYAPASPTSLLIGTFSSNGALHVRLTSSIFADAGQLDGSVPDVAYLISFQLLNPSTGLADSGPLYIVYNNGLPEESHDATIDYVATTLVPEPASLSLPVALLTRRRRPA